MIINWTRPNTLIINPNATLTNNINTRETHTESMLYSLLTLMNVKCLLSMLYLYVIPLGKSFAAHHEKFFRLFHYPLYDRICGVLRPSSLWLDVPLLSSLQLSTWYIPPFILTIGIHDVLLLSFSWLSTHHTPPLSSSQLSICYTHLLLLIMEYTV